VAKLAVLRHEEGVRLNSDCLVALYSRLGEAGAELFMVQALEELSVRLRDIQRLADADNPEELIRNASRVALAADQIGMSSLARVARDVAQAGGAGDMPGRAATIARMMRIADRSLTAVWDMQDVIM
jgi:hypothetical protein